jgi:hypothetical protein
VNGMLSVSTLITLDLKKKNKQKKLHVEFMKDMTTFVTRHLIQKLAAF